MRLDYFCYISRSKVDQLQEHICGSVVDEWTERRSTESDLGASADSDFSIAHVVSLFKGGITYGRKGIIHTEKRVKRGYVEKLEQVLRVLAKSRSLQNLTDALEHQKLNSSYYLHTGLFRCITPLEESTDRRTIISIRCPISEYILTLDCSVQFFSESSDLDGRFYANSSNYRFLQGNLDVKMETLFVLLNFEEINILGTPLYLKLSDSSIVL